MNGEQSQATIAVVVLRLGPSDLNNETRTAIEHLRLGPVSVSVTAVENSSFGEAPAEEHVDRTLRFPSNLGYASAMNRGAAETSSDLLLFLTSDAKPEVTALTLLATAALENPAIGVAGPKLVTGEQTWFGGRWNPRFGWARHWASPQESDPDWLDGSCLCVRRSAFDSIKGFDESTFLYTEDVQFCLRIRENGLRVRLVEAAMVEQETGMTKRSGAHAYLVGRNEIRAMGATGGNPKSYLVAVTLVLRALIEIGRSLTGERTHHIRQTVGFLWGAFDGLRGRTGRPPNLLARWANIPTGSNQ